MAELGIALMPLVLLAGFALTAMLVPAPVLAGVALGLIALGFVVGVPSGLVYHVLLRRALLHRGALPRGWYWAPQRHHGALDEAGVRSLRPWFLTGALGFGLIVLGFLIAVAALLLWFRAQQSALA
ncbi:MAG: hypothetical protein ABW252_06185 [Polyangiales bacterium]